MNKKILSLLVVLLSGFAFAACGIDEAWITPESKIVKTDTVAAHHDKEVVTDDAPAKVQLTLAGGHFHGVAFHQDADAKGILYKKAVQHITLVREGNKWKLAEGSDSVFRVMSANEYQYPYGLWIKYFDKNGKDITTEIAENGESKSHQHFFQAQNVVPTFDGKQQQDDNVTDSLFSYTYMDTNPTNGILKETTVDGKIVPKAELRGSRVIGDNKLGLIFTPENPIGTKGFFLFKRERKRFNMNISLYRFENNAKFLGGTPTGFVAPRAGQRNLAHLEAQFTVPFIVYASREETGLWEKLERVTFADLNTDEQRLVTSTARAYNITIPQAVNEWLEQILGEVDKESGSLWF